MTEILIVKNRPTQAEKLRKILSDAGYAAHVATDAASALAQLGDAKFDLVISDITMRGASGYDLCRRIKASARGKDTPVILFSTLGDPMDVLRSLECGADTFITKSAEPEQIVERIETVLGNRKVRAKVTNNGGVDVQFLGRHFNVTAGKEQILDLLMATFEDIVRTNRWLLKNKTELAAAKAEIEAYARELEGRVETRTAELKRQKVRLDEAQATAHLGNWRWALEADAFEWSDELYRIFGVTRENFQPSREAILAATHADDRDKVAALMDPTLPTGATKRCEARILRPDGEVRQCIWAGRRRTGDESGLEIFVGFCQDISENKSVEKQLQQAQKMEAVGQLTGGVAHDFNNLLTIVVGNLDALLESDKVAGDVRERIEMALSASLRGAELTRQLLAFSRKQQLKMQVCDVNELVRHAATLLGRTLRGDIEIRCKLADNLSPALTDAAQVETALANLAINARDAMETGGTITIETANKVLDETYAAHNAEVTPGEYTMIAVTDCGTGMPPQVLARVFEPFFTTKDVGKGSGLGLSMIYGFVKQSGGHVKIYSEENRGTTVRLYLPKAQTEASAQTKSAKAAPAMPKGDETILIVEDDPMVRNLAVRQLRDLGYTILEAENGAKALDILQNGKAIDLLFTDVVMPGGMSGADLAERVARERPDLKILFTSGFAEASFQNGSRPESCMPMVSKPYRYVELARAVRVALNG